MQPEKLHWLWDSAGDVDPNAARHRDPDALAARIEARHPDPGLAPPAAPAKAFDGWVDESRGISRHLAYQDGALPLGTSPANATLLPPGYVQQVQEVAEDRLALASYRTATVLLGLRQ